MASGSEEKDETEMNSGKEGESGGSNEDLSAPLQEGKNGMEDIGLLHMVEEESDIFDKPAKSGEQTSSISAAMAPSCNESYIDTRDEVSGADSPLSEEVTENVACEEELPVHIPEDSLQDSVDANGRAQDSDEDSRRRWDGDAAWRMEAEVHLITCL